MSDLQMWELVVGFVSATFVLPIVQQPQWTARTRAAVTFAYSVVVGAATAYLTGTFTGVHTVRDAVTGVLLMLVAAIATYHGFAKPVGVAPAIESATTWGPLP
jgi:hypothetical protein